MSCISHHAPCLGELRQETAPAALPVVATLHAIWDAWRDALAAHRQYEHLRSRGVPHDAALRESLALGHIHHTGARHAAKLVYLAGKA
jgi:hypothetical protein